MKDKRCRLWALALVGLTMALAAACGSAAQAPRSMILATTTSTQDSGLLDVLVPAFEKKTGYQVKTIAVGSGQALALGSRGEGDVLLSHAPQAEEEFMAQGFGVNRRPVMHNDFLIVGPPSDPAGIKGMKVTEALRRIAQSQAPFVSRGDDSGTHKMEQGLWKESGIAPSGPWYVESGQGMGATLRLADQKLGYTLADRGTYLAFKGLLALAILVEGDPSLVNQYHVIEVNSSRFPRVNGQGGRAFSDFLVSREGQEIIKQFGVEKFGQPLFFPDAAR